MYEFLWFLILIASLVGLSFARAQRKSASRPEAQHYHGLLDRVIAWCARFSTMELRWWLAIAVLVLVAAVYIGNKGMRAPLNLLLFFERHPVLMTLLLAISLVGFVLVWRGEWTMRRLVAATIVGTAVTLLLVCGWYCLFISLLFLALLGLLWIQSDRLPRLRWVASLLTTFLAAGLLLSRVLFHPTEVQFDVEDQLLIGVVLAVTVLGLIWAWQTQSPLGSWVCGLMLVIFSGGLALSGAGYDVPTWFAGIADYVLFVVLVALAVSGVVWVRSLYMQPLGWVSATMILFLGSGLFFSSILHGTPEDFADIEDQFKYGSIGSDHFMARGIPYFIWEVLPEMFPPEDILGKILPKEFPERETVKDARRYGKADELKGGSYEAFGLVKEEKKKVRLVGQDKDIPMMRPIGFSKRQIFGMDFMGINCAFCHVSTIRKDGLSKPQLMLGMPANTADIELFFHFLFGATEKPRLTFLTAGQVMDEILVKHPEIKFGTQVGKYGIGGVCQEIKNSVHRLSYRFALIPITGTYARKLKKEFYFIDRNRAEHFPRFGPGRVDPWAPTKRTLFTPPLDPFPGGIVDYPAIWNQKARAGMRLHWDGNTDDMEERNTIAFLVVTGPCRECLDQERAKRVADWMTSLPPPRYEDEVKGYGKLSIHWELVEHGKALYRNYCAACHAPDGDRVGRVEPFAALQTDRRRGESFTPELADGLKNSWGLRNFKPQNGYVNMLLDGIWLRAPYLHNGSVPTLWDLLEKPDKRPAKFYRGNDMYDGVKVGFVSEVPEADGRRFFEYDTLVPGNTNGGHVYGTDLSDDEKQALIEYLKTL